MRNNELLLHACCAPCSSHCLECLTERFPVTVFYYNPNIAPDTEYVKRRDELKRLIREMPTPRPVEWKEGRFEPDKFDRFAKGMADCKEGGERCGKCFELRLRETAKVAKEEGYSHFTTTLTVSPHKDEKTIHTIGNEMSAEYGVEFLPFDFKKKNGYGRSIELSKQFRLYRQNYCGCVYSKR